MAKFGICSKIFDKINTFCRQMKMAFLAAESFGAYWCSSQDQRDHGQGTSRWQAVLYDLRKCRRKHL